MKSVWNNNSYINNLPILCLDRSFSEFDTVKEDESDLSTTGKGRKLVCHICQNLITSQADQIEVMGCRLHHRVNPAGFAYNFRCYSSAPGCAVTGVPTSEHTWFTGHVWQVASCKDCLEHLGWFFKGESRFYGLIEGKIIEAPVN